jgi:hypothetical protein
VSEEEGDEEGNVCHDTGESRPTCPEIVSQLAIFVWEACKIKEQ